MKAAQCSQGHTTTVAAVHEAGKTTTTWQGPHQRLEEFCVQQHALFVIVLSFDFVRLGAVYYRGKL